MRREAVDRVGLAAGQADHPVAARRLALRGNLRSHRTATHTVAIPVEATFQSRSRDPRSSRRRRSHSPGSPELADDRRYPSMTVGPVRRCERSRAYRRDQGGFPRPRTTRPKLRRHPPLRDLGHEVIDAITTQHSPAPAQLLERLRRGRLPRAGRTVQHDDPARGNHADIMPDPADGDPMSSARRTAGGRMHAAPTDVVIVGAGIGGSALAKALADDGLDVLVLEQSEVYEDRVRGEAMVPWGVAEARQLGVEQVLLDAGARVSETWINYHLPDQRRDPGRDDDPRHSRLAEPSPSRSVRASRQAAGCGRRPCTAERATSTSRSVPSHACGGARATTSTKCRRASSWAPTVGGHASAKRSASSSNGRR